MTAPANASDLAPPQRGWPWLSGLLLLALPLLLFWQVWWPAAHLRQVFAYGDFVEQHYPMRVFVADEYRHGRLPLWDPYTFGGEPAVAMSLFAPYYPPGLWQTIFPRLPFEALELEAIFHLGLAGLFTSLFVRRLTGNAGAGLLAGLAFSLGGYLTSYPMLQLIILETAVWLPAGLWLLERGLARRSPGDVALAGVAFGVGVLAGHPQTFLYMAYLAAAYFLLRAVQLQLPMRFILAVALILPGITLGISAAHWLPGLQMYGLSPRASLTYADVANGFQPAELLGLVRPNPGQWSPLYVGIIPLGLGLIGLALRRCAETWFWAAGALVALLLSLGRHGFLYPLFYRFVPGFSTFRNQERIALLVSFALAMLAGYGYVALMQRWMEGGSKATVRHALVPLSRFLLPLLAALTFLDLYRANNGIILQPPPAGGYFAVTPSVAHLQSVSLPGWRTSSEGLLPGDGEAGIVFGIRDIVGSGPLYLAAYDRFLQTVPEERWWRMLNVQHLLTRRELQHGALKLVLQEDDRRLYQIFQNATLPWIVHAFRLAADQEAAIQLTGDPAFDPFVEAVLETAPALLLAPAIGPEEARLVSFAHQRVAVEATLSAPGILVLGEVAYPGWTVAANGQRLTPLRAYGLLRAVALPAGRWLVEWRFRPLVAYLGLAISLLTWAGVGVMIWVLRRKKVSAEGKVEVRRMTGSR